jgi:hypothetical protein
VKNLYTDIYDMTKSGEFTPPNLITKPELTFWLPLFGLGVTIALTFASLSSRVDLLNQKLDTVTELQKELVTKYASVESRYGTLTLRIQALEIKTSK